MSNATPIIPPAGDAEPVDVTSLSSASQEALARIIADFERHRLRAEALHERLAERGLAREAEILRVRQLEASQLDALEAIVARLEIGAMPDLLAALQTGGTDAALHLLEHVQDPENSAAFGERVALAVICRTDDEGLDFHIASDAGDKIREAIEVTAESLRNRLELVDEALRRLDAAGL